MVFQRFANVLEHSWTHVRQANSRILTQECIKSHSWQWYRFPFDLPTDRYHTANYALLDCHSEMQPAFYSWNRFLPFVFHRFHERSSSSAVCLASSVNSDPPWNVGDKRVQVLFRLDTFRRHLSISNRRFWGRHEFLRSCTLGADSLVVPWAACWLDLQLRWLSAWVHLDR